MAASTSSFVIAANSDVDDEFYYPFVFLPFRPLTWFDLVRGRRIESYFTRAR
jgi:hypothetical protein